MASTPERALSLLRDSYPADALRVVREFLDDLTSHVAHDYRDEQAFERVLDATESYWRDEETQPVLVIDYTRRDGGIWL